MYRRSSAHGQRWAARPELPSKVVAAGSRGCGFARVVVALRERRVRLSALTTQDQRCPTRRPQHAMAPRTKDENCSRRRAYPVPMCFDNVITGGKVIYSDLKTLSSALLLGSMLAFTHHPGLYASLSNCVSLSTLPMNSGQKALAPILKSRSRSACVHTHVGCTRW